MFEKIANSKHFKKYTDPQSGVVTYVFDNDYVPHTQSFYFTNPSVSDDGRYIWMYCAFPPAGDAGVGRSLGLIDLETDTFTHFPNCMFHDATPLVDTETAIVYYTDGQGMWKKTPDMQSPELIAPYPKEMRRHGALRKIATHLTYGPGKKKVCFDACVGPMHAVIGDIDMETGEYREWYKYTEHFHNHAQLNPVKPDVMLFAQEEYADLFTSEMHWITEDENGKLNRLWTMKYGEEPKKITPLFKEARHEWWSADGEIVYYVDWDNGTISYDTRTGELKVIDPNGTWHAHSSKDDKYFVADENEIDGTKWYRGCLSRVHFFNAETGKAVNIVSENPALFTREKQSRYHTDPHPQFVVGDTAVAFTATVTGKVSFAITEVKQLVEKTKR